MSEYMEKCRQIRAASRNIWNDEQVRELKRRDFEVLLEMYNRVSREKDDFEKLCLSCPMSCDKRKKEEYRGTFDGAKLKLVLAIQKRLEEYPEDGEQYGEMGDELVKEFSDAAIAIMRDFESFSEFDRENLDAEVIKDEIKKKGKLYSLIKEAVEKQYISLGALRNTWKSNLDISNAIITVLEERYHRRFGKVVDGIVLWLKDTPTALVEVFREYEESLVESRNLRGEAESLAREMEREETHIEDEKNRIEKDNELLEERLAELEKELMEEKGEKKAMELQVSIMQNERQRLEEQLKDIYSKWDSKFEMIERKRKELEEQEMKLEKIKEAAKKEAAVELENEMRLLREQIEGYSKTMERYKALKNGLEADNMALKEKIEEINAALRGEVDARPVLAEEAKQYEMAFIGRFERKMEDLPLELPNPLEKGKRKAVKDWGDNHSIMSAKERIRKMSGKNAEELPQNIRSRYTLRGFFSGKRVGVVEGMAYNHLAEYAKLGLDTKKATLGELLSILSKVIESAEKGRYFHILGIESPTGWDEKAIEFLTSEEYQKNFLNKYVYVYLVDVELNRIYYNKIYDRMIDGMSVYAELFKPHLQEEKAEECKRKIMKRLKDLSEDKSKYEVYITLSEAAKMCGKRSTAKMAFIELQEKGKAKMKNVPNVGIVLTRR